VPIDQDRYGRTVADLFIKSDRSEIHLNSQMILDGMAYHYAQYSSNCPQPNVLAKAEEMAKSNRAGLWDNPNAQRPWDYRKSK
ncbi:MAG: thermonuclease family protein, partial [Cyanobacteria bacterium J06635_15]